MHITIVFDTNTDNADHLLKLAHGLLSEFVVSRSENTITSGAVNTTAEGKPSAPAFIAREVAAQNAAAATSKPEESATTEKPARKTRSKEPAAAPASVENGDPAPVASVPVMTRDEVKARLSDYAADKRFGMEGVFKILAKYGVQKISVLPEKDFAAFRKEIDDALAMPANAPAADPLS